MRGHRVGVVNSRTPFGGRVRELLDGQHLPVIELKLFESEVDGEATLTQFNDEVVVTQPVDPDLFPHLDVLFFAAEDTDLMNRLARDAAADDVLTLVHGAIDLDAPVLAPGFDEDEAASERLIQVPRVASYLVGTVLRRVREAFGPGHANATVLLPAGDRGAAGANELHQQVVNILNFKSPPTDVFGEQVAFNVNVAGAGPKAAAIADAVGAEAAGLSGMSEVAVNVVRVPVFHGYAASIWVELDSEPKRSGAKAFAAAFREPPFAIETGRAAVTPSPIKVAESSRIHVGGIRRASAVSRPGFWLWAVADTTAYDPGYAAVELAKEILA